MLYLRETQKAQLAHIRSIAFRETADAMVIDPPTLKHLEVVVSSEGTRAGSLLGEIDKTVTVMGSRLLRGWLLRPLVSLERVHNRLDAVEELAFRSLERGKLREAFKSVQDMERLVAARRDGCRGASGPGCATTLPGDRSPCACHPASAPGAADRQSPG